MSDPEPDVALGVPGSPRENAYAESFNSRFRDEFLALEVFDSLTTAKRLTVQYRTNYIDRRPHSLLGYETPANFARQFPAFSACDPEAENWSRSQGRTTLTGLRDVWARQLVRLTKSAILSDYAIHWNENGRMKCNCENLTSTEVFSHAIANRCRELALIDQKGNRVNWLRWNLKSVLGNQTVPEGFNLLRRPGSGNEKFR